MLRTAKVVGAIDVLKLKFIKPCAVGGGGRRRSEITDGECSVTLDGDGETSCYPAGQHFDVSANSRFTIAAVNLRLSLPAGRIAAETTAYAVPPNFWHAQLL
ncbi:MAG: pyrimidine/purine nucleoside phosphorylase [Verrucomicrobiales bacterium]